VKLLIATDGSAPADVAVDLVAALPWEAGSSARVVTALDTVRLAGPWAGRADYEIADLEASLLRELEATVHRSAERVAAAGVATDDRVLLGRPSSVIVGSARELGADLIVVGSRGRGPIRTMLLGSVSAEVVDHAPCPVLVARRRTLERTLLAHDGSDLARRAEELLAAPAFAGPPVEVLSVVRVGDTPSVDSIDSSTLGRSLEAHAVSLEEARRHHEDIASAAAERLRRSGRAATWSVRAGDPARAIVETAEAEGIDLIALGTHGRTGLDRLVVGSVARNVLTHAQCSVLVAPATQQPASPGPPG
jgi:nucleotide-binding universal stress UspA family protein